MKRKLSILFLLVLLLCAGIGIGGQRRRTKSPLPITALSINLSPLKLNLDRVLKCPAPRPKDIGCTTLCKPCITWRCQNGQWVEYDLSKLDDEICEPLDIGDRPLSACPRSEEGFCPAECSMCY